MNRSGFGHEQSKRQTQTENAVPERGSSRPRGEAAGHRTRVFPREETRRGNGVLFSSLPGSCSRAGQIWATFSQRAQEAWKGNINIVQTVVAACGGIAEAFVVYFALMLCSVKNTHPGRWRGRRAGSSASLLWGPRRGSWA